MQRFFVTCDGQLVGSTDLEFLDEGMGVAHGRFYPGPGYEVFRRRVLDAAEARHARAPAPADRPRFEVTAAAGELVRTRDVVIDDFDDVAVDPAISVFLDDRDQFLRLAGRSR